MEQRHFCQASLNYVFLLQEVQESKKYELAETVSRIFFFGRSVIKKAWSLIVMSKLHCGLVLLAEIILTFECSYNTSVSFELQLLGFMYGWLTFYHQGHEVATDSKPYMIDLQKRIQNVRHFIHEKNENGLIIINYYFFFPSRQEKTLRRREIKRRC
jgi:hypothetical protein